MSNFFPSKVDVVSSWNGAKPPISKFPGTMCLKTNCFRLLGWVSNSSKAEPERKEKASSLGENNVKVPLKE